MALNFTNATTDRVTVAANASHTNLTAMTQLFWLYPTSLVSNAILARKGTVLSTGWFSSLNDALGNIRVRQGQTAQPDYRTNNTPLATVNKWYCVAVSGDTAASAGQRFNIYVGDLATAVSECTYGTATDGSGGLNSDTGLVFTVGNSPSAASNFPGYIAIFQLVNRVMTQGEIQSWQFHPRVVSGTVSLMHFGFNGTSTQPDWSGSANSGTVTGATVTAHVPLPPLFGYARGYQGNATSAAPPLVNNLDNFFLMFN